MARRRREFGPHYQTKMAMSLASAYASRMGPLAESPLWGDFVIMDALQTANKWYNSRVIINNIYEDALSKLGKLPPFERFKVSALANAAGSVVINAFRGKLNRPAKEVLDEVLARANKKVGAPDSYVEAVKKAALARLGIFDTT